MSSPDPWIREYLRRFHFAQWLQRATEWSAIYLFLLGGVILVVKLVGLSVWPSVLVLTAGLPVVWGLAWLTTKPEWITAGEAVAMLDRKLNAGGLLMAIQECPDTDWADRLPQEQQQWRSALPKLRPTRSGRMLFLPVVFLIATCFVPLREARPAPELIDTVGQQAAESLAEMFETLKEEELLDEQSEDTLRDEIAQLSKETQSAPLTHEKWETVDALREQMHSRITSATAQLQNALAGNDALSETQMLEGMPGDEILQMEKRLGEALGKLGTPFAGELPEGMKSDLQRLMQTGRLPTDSARRQALQEELRKRLESELNKMASLQRKCQGGACSQCGSENCQGGQCLGQGDSNSNKPGQGGVTRGRGDAALTFGEESELQQKKFKQVVLPPGFEKQPGETTIGISARTPEAEPAASATRSEQRDFSATAGGTAWQRDFRPKHRSVVRQYFGRPTE